MKKLFGFGGMLVCSGFLAISALYAFIIPGALWFKIFNVIAMPYSAYGIYVYTKMTRA